MQDHSFLDQLIPVTAASPGPIGVTHSLIENREISPGLFIFFPSLPTLITLTRDWLRITTLTHYTQDAAGWKQRRCKNSREVLCVPSSVTLHFTANSYHLTNTTFPPLLYFPPQVITAPQLLKLLKSPVSCSHPRPGRLSQF